MTIDVPCLQPLPLGFQQAGELFGGEKAQPEEHLPEGLSALPFLLRNGAVELIVGEHAALDRDPAQKQLIAFSGGHHGTPIDGRGS